MANTHTQMIDRLAGVPDAAGRQSAARGVGRAGRGARVTHDGPRDDDGHDDDTGHDRPADTRAAGPSARRRPGRGMTPPDVPPTRSTRRALGAAPATP